MIAKITRSEITQELLKSLFEYDTLTGNLIWKISRARAKQGDVAGYIKRGKWLNYREIRLGSVNYSAHRLVWLFHYGKWPEQSIDHKDRNPLNNRIENLRDVSQAENMQNQSFSKANTTGFRGVYLQNGKFHAAIGVDGTLVTFGSYGSAAEASLAYRSGRFLLGKAEAHGHADLPLVWPTYATALPVLKAAQAFEAFKAHLQQTPIANPNQPDYTAKNKQRGTMKKSHPITISKSGFEKLKQRGNLSNLATKLFKAYVENEIKVPAKTLDENHDTSVYLDEALYRAVKEKSAQDGMTPHYVLQTLLEIEADK